MAGTRRATLREASEILGVSIEAVRKRVKRGSLRSDKGPDSRVYVYLDEGRDASHPRPKVESSELVEELRDRVHSLERMLEREREARTEERRRHDTLMAQLTQYTTALSERLRELEGPRGTEDPSQGVEEAGLSHKITEMAVAGTVAQGIVAASAWLIPVVVTSVAAAVVATISALNSEFVVAAASGLVSLLLGALSGSLLSRYFTRRRRAQLDEALRQAAEAIEDLESTIEGRPPREDS